MVIFIPACYSYFHTTKYDTFFLWNCQPEPGKNGHFLQRDRGEGRVFFLSPFCDTQTDKTKLVSAWHLRNDKMCAHGRFENEKTPCAKANFLLRRFYRFCRPARGCGRAAAKLQWNHPYLQLGLCVLPVFPGLQRHIACAACQPFPQLGQGATPPWFPFSFRAAEGLA